MLTPEIRKAIYGLVAAVLAAAVVFGFVSEDQSASLLEVTAQALGVLAALLALRNVPTTEG